MSVSGYLILQISSFSLWNSASSLAFTHQFVGKPEKRAPSCPSNVWRHPASRANGLTHCHAHSRAGLDIESSKQFINGFRSLGCKHCFEPILFFNQARQADLNSTYFRSTSCRLRYQFHLGFDFINLILSTLLHLRPGSGKDVLQNGFNMRNCLSNYCVEQSTSRNTITISANARFDNIRYWLLDRIVNSRNERINWR